MLDFVLCDDNFNALTRLEKDARVCYLLSVKLTRVLH